MPDHNGSPTSTANSNTLAIQEIENLRHEIDLLEQQINYYLPHLDSENLSPQQKNVLRNNLTALHTQLDNSRSNLSALTQGLGSYQLSQT